MIAKRKISGNFMWQELNKYVEQFESLGLAGVVDFDKFNRIAIVHHSSAIEGSTLTLEETGLLISEGVTAKGKPMSEHEMVKDHHGALLFALDEAGKRTPITPELLRQINARVNKNTGKIRHTAMGICDDSKGDFRLGNVTAGTTYFVNYDKVRPMVNDLCSKLKSKIGAVQTNKEIYGLSFDAHYYLVSIHPWFDGNGRTARLLMNFVQAFHRKPLSLIFLEDKPGYIQALNNARTADDIEIFRDFMCGQLVKHLKIEIEKFEQRNKGITFII